MKDRFPLAFLGIVASVTAIVGGAVLLTDMEVEARTKPEPSTEAPPPRAANAKMLQLSAILSDLLPNVVSEARFNDAKNFKSIEENTRKLVELSHKIQAPKSTADRDLSLPVFSGMLEQDTQRANEALKSGNREYARSILKSIPNFCIACHTRSGSPGTATQTAQLQLDPKASFLSRTDKAKYLAAIRRFDEALDSFEEVVADPTSAEARNLEWERSARSALILAIRVKKDPDAALRIVERVLASKSGPQFLKADAAKWKESLLEWKSEPSKTAATEAGLISEAENLFAKAQKKQSSPMDRSGDVLYLRASAALHEFLDRYPESPKAAEALLLLGISYEVLRDLDLWSLHEMLYEACIFKAPGSAEAKSCYKRFEESVYFGYTGSSGTSLPSDVRKHLDTLKKLSQKTLQ